MKSLLPALLLIPAGLAAQPHPDSLRKNAISEVIISSSVSLHESGATATSTLDSKTLEEKNYGQEASYLLRETPSITNTSDAGSYWGYSYFRLRGIDQTRINMTLDGVPLNEPEDQGVYFSNYPDFFNSVSRVQILRGVGESSYGTASYAGSISMTGPRLFDSTRTELGAGYGSFNSYRAYGEYNSGVKKHTGLYARVSQLHSDGYKEHSANTSASGFLSGGWFGDKHSFRFTAFGGDQRNQLAWLGAPMDSLKKNPRYNENGNECDHFRQAHMQLHHVYRIGQYRSISSCVYYNYLKGGYDFDLNNYLGLSSTSELYRYDFLSHFAGAYSTIDLSTIRYALKIGVQGNTYQRQHIGSVNTSGELYHNTGYKNEASVFIKSSSVFHRSTRWSFGVFEDLQFRYTDFQYRGWTTTPRLNWWLLSPKGGISMGDGRHSFYYSIGSAGREPTRNDLLLGSDELLADSAGQYVWLTDFTHEKVFDQELGWQYTRDSFQLRLNLYRMQFKNELVMNGAIGPNGLPLTFASEHSVRSGVELEWKWTLRSGIYLSNNTTYAYNRIHTRNVELAHVLSPALLSNQTIGWRNKKFYCSVTARYQSESWIDYANTTKLPAFFVIDANVGLQIKKIGLSVSGNNLTNARYYANGLVSNGTALYFLQAPINFFASATYTF